MKPKDTLYSFFYWFIIIINTIFFGTAAIVISFFDSSGMKAQNVAKLWARTILYLLNITVVADGLSNIDRKSSYLIVSNHQSYFDIFILLSYLNVDFKFVAKSSLFKIPFLGWSMKRLGYISVDRKNLKKTLSLFNQINLSNKASENVSDSERKNKKNAAVSILIFPEGTRSDDGRLKDFKTAGLKRFIEILNLPILPVVISGTFGILKKNSLRIYGGKTVRLKVLKPVLTETHGTRSTSDLIQNIEGNINKEFFS
ncbi:MAG: 1-acyl-sn-glycerol-3-phosphate acyltransferase [Candidatus Acididesulfobacter guangdongensis]|uniref:1-acyl-sn-glycerol-3-phosphate acyltransferase n=1 Tax=Acididesulfobacter guangdongensis TaxID=2597225 RepID=A0A519BIP1_ACIG2|nr:MAG: 1-acyl-sn-glycerol-3-phosphate acyltransferase [Candidatus Acididesulfobacter guangdongensis]